MKKLDREKVSLITDIQLKYLTGKIGKFQAREVMKENNISFSAIEFALGQQRLANHGISNLKILENLPEIMEIFEGFIICERLNLESGHPLTSYQAEIDRFCDVFRVLQGLNENDFNKAANMEAYNQLLELKVHFVRKQETLYPLLDKKGYEMPSKVMKSLDEELQKLIQDTCNILKYEQEDVFREMNEAVISLGLDLMGKTESILLPAACGLISDEEFVQLRALEEDYGFALLHKPPHYKGSKNKDTELVELPCTSKTVEIVPQMLLQDVLKLDPRVKSFIRELGEKNTQKCNLFSETMKDIANIQMVAQHHGMPVEDLILLLKKSIAN